VRQAAPRFGSEPRGCFCRRPVSRILSRTIIPLGDALLRRSSDLPGGFPPTNGRTACGNPVSRAGPARIHGLGLAAGFPPYLVLLRVGFTLPPPLQAARCALTAPFHPYRGLPKRPMAVCFLWHWPSLSLDAQIPDVIRHAALWSSDFPLPKRRSAPAAIARLTCSVHGRAFERRVPAMAHS
jgi:hypothetical protein